MMRERHSDDIIDVDANEEKHFDIDMSDAEAVKNAVAVKYTKDDFLYTEKPYEAIYDYKNDPFMHNLKIEQMAQQAAEVGVKTFKGLYKNYVKMREMQRGANVIINNPTAFSGPYMQLDAGKYNVDDGGVYLIDESGNYHVICHHPIIPFECLQNIDTGEEKLNIAYRTRGEWQEKVVSKEILYNSRNISQLVKCGVDVSSETAKELVSYFQEIESLNRNSLPLKRSVGRLGYINGAGFSPYVEGLTFDGEQNYSTIFSAIKSHGSYEKWKKVAIDCRRKSVIAKIFLAASFASALIQPLGGLPFFVHLWGVDSGTGKTVALMLAASVWGTPEMGEYIQTFNSTVVGHERTAAFLNSLPFLIDELQLSKDSHGRSRFDVYQLAQGVGRSRGTKTGGIERTPTWRNTILTTGESPIVGGSAGAGAVNRVIDIECTSNNVVIADGMAVSAVIKQNYGFAGREFVVKLSSQKALTMVQEVYNDYFTKLCKSDTTEKQAMAAAMILTADMVAEASVFKTNEPLTIDDISPYLQTKKSVSAGERGYQYMCDWVASNSKRFATGEDNNGEVFGLIQGDFAYIIRSKFDEAASKQGFDTRALLSWLKSNGKILVRGRNNTRGKRIGGVNVECVVLRLPDETPDYYTEEEMRGTDLSDFGIL